MLVNSFMEDCIFLEKRTVSDGQGGFETSYIDGAQFKCAIVTNQNIQTKIAEKQGVTSLYNITSKKNVVLEFHDIIKRKSDNQIFRITSNSKDIQTPNISTLDFYQVSAEKWSLI